MKKLARLFLLALMLAPALLPSSAHAQQSLQIQSTNAALFPWWTIRKVGYPILLESNFAETFPNGKWGVLESSTGTVTTDTNIRWGGTGSAKLLTAATNLDGSELKTTIASVARCGDKVAFESKFAINFAQATTEYQIGLESRDNANIYQARFSATCSGGTATCTWQYESATGVYSDFSVLPGYQGSATTPSPLYNVSAGTPIGWARIVIDPCARTYYSFEIPNISSGGTTIFDMRTVALPINGTSTRTLYLPFAYVITHSTTAEPAYTTDWVVSIIPKGTNPNL